MKTSTQHDTPNAHIIEIPKPKDSLSWISDLRRHADLLRAEVEAKLPDTARRAELGRLEDRILTLQPKSLKEVKILLLLLTRMILAKRDLEPAYLSEILEECAAALRHCRHGDVQVFRKRMRPM